MALSISIQCMLIPHTLSYENSVSRATASIYHECQHQHWNIGEGGRASEIPCIQRGHPGGQGQRHKVVTVGVIRM